MTLERVATILPVQGEGAAPIEILEELGQFTIPERLTIVEAMLRLIRQDIQDIEQPLPQTERKRQLAAAAKSLLPDYADGGELTTFTALDGENFYA